MTHRFVTHTRPPATIIALICSCFIKLRTEVSTDQCALTPHVYNLDQSGLDLASRFASNVTDQAECNAARATSSLTRPPAQSDQSNILSERNRRRTIVAALGFR